MKILLSSLSPDFAFVFPLLCAQLVAATVDVLVPAGSSDIHYGPNVDDWGDDGHCGNTTFIYSEGYQSQWVTLEFTGIAISVFMNKQTDGTRVAIEIDGSKVTEVDTYQNHVICNTKVFEKKALPFGPHQIKVSDLSANRDYCINSQGFSYKTYTAQELASMSISFSATQTSMTTSISASQTSPPITTAVQTGSSSLAPSATDKKSRQTIIGAAVGGGIGLLLVVLVVIWLLWRRQTRNATPPQDPTPFAIDTYETGAWQTYEPYPSPPIVESEDKSTQPYARSHSTGSRSELVNLTPRDVSAIAEALAQTIATRNPGGPPLQPAPNYLPASQEPGRQMSPAPAYDFTTYPEVTPLPRSNMGSSSAIGFIKDGTGLERAGVTGSP